MKIQLLEAIYKSSTCLTEEEFRQYLDGSIQKSTMQKVELHLLDCDLCTDALDGYRGLGITKPSVSLPNTFFDSELSKNVEKSPNAKIRTLPRLLLRVAAMISILLVSYFTFFRAPSFEQLYHTYYEAYASDIPLTQRSATNLHSINPNFEQGLKEYNNANYSGSLIHFEKAVVQEPENFSIQFFTGISCMEVGQFPQAIEYFKAVKEADSLYSEKANWFLALSFIKIGEKENAIKCLDEVIASNNYKGQEAKKLKRKLIQG